jgi:hypothetical protein
MNDDKRKALLDRIAAIDPDALEALEAVLASAPPSDNRYLEFLDAVAASDVRGLHKAEKSYGASWKRRTGIGAFMMLARKWDRIEKRVATPIVGAADAPPAAQYDVFDHIAADRRVEGIIDDIRDLRRYLMLVEAEMAARGVVKIGTARDDVEG